MKLYNQNEIISLPTLEQHVLVNKYTDTIDKDITLLNKHISAFNSLVIVEEQISEENYNFIDKNNYVLYNEYIKTITKNLNVKTIPIISQEDISTLSTTALNHHIALEGFIKDIWEKIKLIFNKIYNGIKEFFKRYFTRLGRLKGRLKNLSEVLDETDKELDSSKYSLEKVPNDLASKYPFGGTLNSNKIIEVLVNTNALVSSVDNINKKANDFVSKDILDKNFVDNINKLKQDIQTNKEQIEANNKNKKEGILFKEAKFGEAGKVNAQLNKENSSLADEIKEKSKEVNEATDKVNSITNKEINLDQIDVKAREVEKEFESFIKVLVETLNKVKGKNLINGKKIVSVTGSIDDGLEIETDQLDDKPESVMLGTKTTLLKIINDTISMIETAEKLTEAYGKVNDVVIENMNKVDKLISDLDKVTDGDLGKYKKLLSNKIKVRLNLAKTFFNNYNKVTKNIFEMALDSADGAVSYTILSLKYFS